MYKDFHTYNSYKLLKRSIIIQKTNSLSFLSLCLCTTASASSFMYFLFNRAIVHINIYISENVSQVCLEKKLLVVLLLSKNITLLYRIQSNNTIFKC